MDIEEWKILLDVDGQRLKPVISTCALIPRALIWYISIISTNNNYRQWMTSLVLTGSKVCSVWYQYINIGCVKSNFLHIYLKCYGLTIEHSRFVWSGTDWQRYILILMLAMNSSVEHEFLLLKEEYIKLNIPNIFISVFYFLFGVTGNLCVLLVYCLCVKRRQNRYYIPFLALVDLLSCFMNSAWEIMFDMLPLTYNDNMGCKWIRFLGNALVILSGFLLVVIALQRFMLVCRPLRHPSSVMKKNIVLLLTLVLALGFSSPKFVFTGIAVIRTRNPGINGTVCGILDEYSNTTSLLIYDITLRVLGGICYVTLIILYIFVVRAIYVRNQKLSESHQTTARVLREGSNNNSVDDGPHISTPRSSQHIAPGREQRDSDTSANIRNRNIIASHRFSIMFFVITLIILITYAPRLTIESLEAMDKNFAVNFSDVEIALKGFFENLYILNGVINPLIYGYFDREFRIVLKRKLCGR